MTSELIADIHQVITTISGKPALSIFLPFEPKMTRREELQKQLKYAVEKVSIRILEQYDPQAAKPVLQRTLAIIEKLDYDTHKKSVAIFVSPLFEKLLYLDITVEEKIILDDSFEIRDLVYARKDVHKYLVAIISGNCFKVFIGNSKSFIRIITNLPDHISSVDRDIPERVANFSDPSEQKEIRLKKFLHQMDDALTDILKTYPLPVFILGTEKTAGYFKALTKNTLHIIEYIPGNYEEASEAELKNILHPFVADWKKLKLKDIYLQLENAANVGRLTIGMKAVWNEALQHKGQKLVVEKNYMYPSAEGREDDFTRKHYDEFSCIRDIVDDTIEQVLKDGGDIEFVDEGGLQAYQHIALIRYY